MSIVSVSLTDKNLQILDKIQESLGLAGRSEAVRVCIRSAETEARDREELVGNVEGVLIIVHQTHSAPQLDGVRHKFQELITTQIHSHLKHHRCLEVFIIRGGAQDIKTMLSSFQSNDHFEYVKFLKS